MSALGLGYVQLAAVNPRVICASVTPFGQAGRCPQPRYRPDDRSARPRSASPGKIPTGRPCPSDTQASFTVAGRLPPGCIAALNERERSGRGAAPRCLHAGRWSEL
ncbi:MAG: CoA transferase [Dehalococcoidia bacterium]|nr:CoA transferase [Dehalococcoidia bacterium]